VFRGPLAANLQRPAIDECALGSKSKDAILEDPCPARASRFVARESVSPYQHDNHHDDQDKYKCSSSNEHEPFPFFRWMLGVGVPPWGLKARWAWTRQAAVSVQSEAGVRPNAESNWFLAKSPLAGRTGFGSCNRLAVHFFVHFCRLTLSVGRLTVVSAFSATRRTA